MQQERCQQLSRAFQVLGHPTKLRILDFVLGDTDEAVVPTLIAVKMNMPVARVSYSLKRMHEAGILERKVTGRYTFYSIDPQFLKLIEEFFPCQR